MVTKYEYRVLKKVIKSELSANDIRNISGIIDIENLIHSLETSSLIKRHVLKENEFREPIKYGGYIPDNLFKCKKEIWMYRRDMFRTLYPYVVSTIALIISAMALYRSW